MDSPHMGPPGIVPGIMNQDILRQLATVRGSTGHVSVISILLQNPHSTSVEKPGEHAGCVLETN